MKRTIKAKITLCVMFIVALILIANAQAADCTNHPIFCQIKENLSKERSEKGFIKIKLNMSDKEIMELSNIIYKYSRKHDIPANLYTAMLRQESTYKLAARGCRWGLDEDFNKVRTCIDFGMSMINLKTAENFNFDIKRLTTDLEYSVECGAIVLADFKKRYFHKEEFWWTRYNASTSYKRKIYRNLVEDWLP